MIYWHLRDHGELAAEVTRHGDYDFLSAEERRRFAGLKVDKRREDWLLGRWTAKLLLCGYLAREAQSAVTLDAVTVANAPSGAPVVRFATGDWIADDAVSLSISHSHGRALCAFSDEPGVAVGADIELVEPRPQSFAGDYFAAAELAALESLTAAQRELMTTAIWSAKEAVLKALTVGLRVDTRRVCCAWEEPPDAEGWRRFVATYDDPELAPSAADSTLNGWWRLAGPYVLTLASLKQPTH